MAINQCMSGLNQLKEKCFANISSPENETLQFLNGKQQDSQGNFVSQLNKIFNKKYSLKNDLYRIYSKQSVCRLN